MVTLYLPTNTTNDTFDEESNQRKCEDTELKVNSSQKQGKNKGLCKSGVALIPQKEDSHNSTIICKNF